MLGQNLEHNLLELATSVCGDLLPVSAERKIVGHFGILGLRGRVVQFYWHLPSKLKNKEAVGFLIF